MNRETPYVVIITLFVGLDCISWQFDLDLVNDFDLEILRIFIMNHNKSSTYV